MEATKALKTRIAELKEELQKVQGSETEVYTRIVGYYRPVKNWNRGKKEEFGLRKTFTKLDGNNRKTDTVVPQEHDMILTNPQGTSEYLYFFRQRCPNCPPVAQALDEISLKGTRIDVDTPEGMELSGKFNIMTAPTVVFTDSDGKEVFRTSRTDAISSVGLNKESEKITV